MASQPSDPLLMGNMTSQPRQVDFRLGPAEAERLLTYVPAEALARRAQRRAVRQLLAVLAASESVSIPVQMTGVELLDQGGRRGAGARVVKGN